MTFVDDQNAVSFLHSAQTMSYDQNGSAHRAVVDRLLDLTKGWGKKEGNSVSFYCEFTVRKNIVPKEARESLTKSDH